MFDKRLLSLVPGVRRLMIGKVIAMWVSLMMDIAFVFTLVGLLGALFAHVEPLALLDCARRGSLATCLAGAQAHDLTRFAPDGPLQLDVFGYGEYLLAFVLIAVCKYVATLLASTCGDRAAQRVKLALRERLYRKVLRLGPAYTQRVRTSEVIQAAGEGIDKVQSIYELFLPQVVFAIVAPLTLFAVLLPVNAIAASVMLVCAPLIIVITRMVSAHASRTFGRYWGRYADMGAAFLDNLQGLETLKSFDADSRAAATMAKKAEDFRTATMRVLRVQLRSLCAMDVVAYGGAAAGIIAAVWQFAYGRIWLPNAMLIVLLSVSFFLPVRQLGSYFHVAMSGVASSRRLFALLDAPEPEYGDVRLPEDVGAVSIAFDRVDYAYESDRTPGHAPGHASVHASATVSKPASMKALRGVSFTADVGSLTAIVGASGSGKSTAAALLAGQLVGYHGSIGLRYRGLTGPGAGELRTLSRESHSALVTLVTTHSYLLAGTLRDNLAMARPNATDNEMWQALKRARIDGFVYRESKGLDMRIEQGAANLSGGQRQRLCIARALLHDTPVYVFDEATSSVDARSEALIVGTIRELAQNHTVLMITHRLADAVNADRIVVMDHGQVVEQGGHEALIARNGVYATLFRAQQAKERVSWRGNGPRSPESVDAMARSASRVSTAHGSAATIPASNPAPQLETQPASNPAAQLASQPESQPERQSAPQPVPGSPKPLSTFAVVRRLLSVVGPLWPVMALACVFGILGQLAAALLPVSGVLALFAALNHPIWGIGMEPAVIVMVVCALVRGAMRMAEQLMNHDVAFRLLALLRNRMFAALRRLAPAKLVGKGRGDLVSLVTADVELLEIFFAHTISPTVIALVTTVVFAVGVGMLHPWFALLLVIAHLLVGLILPRIFALSVHTVGPRLRSRAAALDDAMFDDLRGIGEIIRYGRGPVRLERIIGKARSLRALQSKISRRTARFHALSGVLVMCATMAAAVVAMALAQTDAALIPAGLVAFTLLSGSFGPTLALGALPANLTQTFAAARRLFALIDEKPAVEENGTETPQYDGMALEHVDFAYAQPDAVRRVLRDYSLRVPAHGILGIQGRSGRGKSTVLHLLMRYWDPQAGQVVFSGRPLTVVDAAYRRHAQAFMSQETYLFDGTIRDNLLMACADGHVDGKGNVVSGEGPQGSHAIANSVAGPAANVTSDAVTDDVLLEALRHASALDLVESLPHGLDTEVGELGGRLSEGERQRLGLARIFLRGASLALFDEPTSRVDALNEAVMLHSIAELADHGTAVVLVSHREQAMQIADEVVRM
ncbi:ATP-binding cassette domain-containing protein [Bifidobacterium mongoliense]|uniref:ABC transporter ATP-binding protein n=1 Tax=Bifidobacterium mongoliense DSM 21395 TaxID=1437603 RepID=A0A087BZN2_9BIFI|nr:ATP-binding cassette domain-containing protein [Bifidobacterium mongoliense]KFI76482.1 ABC transporter ATP-binding protein [Bifidobacterium mongoliense DSM 21395]